MNVPKGEGLKGEVEELSEVSSLFIGFLSGQGTVVLSRKLLMLSIRRRRCRRNPAQVTNCRLMM